MQKSHTINKEKLVNSKINVQTFNFWFIFMEFKMCFAFIIFLFKISNFIKKKLLIIIILIYETYKALFILAQFIWIRTVNMAKSIDLAGAVEKSFSISTNACDLTEALVENNQEKGKVIAKFFISNIFTFGLAAVGAVVTGGNPIGAYAGETIGSVISDIISKKL